MKTKSLFLIIFSAIGLFAIAMNMMSCDDKNSGSSDIAGVYYSFQDNTETELKLLNDNTFSFSMDQYIPRTGNELETYGNGYWTYSNGKIRCEGYFYRINHKNPDSDWAKKDIYEFEYHNTYLVRGSITLNKK